MNDLIFTTRKQVIDFLKARSIEDHDIRWKCPSCETVNLGAYYSHSTPCGGCDDFVFPRLNLKEILKDDNEATEIAKEIDRYTRRIEQQREIIADLEGELSDERTTLRDLYDELKCLKTCNVGKVKKDW